MVCVAGERERQTRSPVFSMPVYLLYGEIIVLDSVCVRPISGKACAFVPCHFVGLNRRLIAVFFAVMAFAQCSAFGDLLNFHRMGAGAPAGWRVDGQDYAWEANTADATERESCVFQPGSAKIAFGEHGRVEIQSPVIYIPAGASCLMELYLASEPPGARVSIALHDNDTGRATALQQSQAASSEEQKIFLIAKPEPALKDRYCFVLTAEGKNTTLWLDRLILLYTTGQPPREWGLTESYGLSFVLEPEAPWGVVTGDAPLRVRARIAGEIPEQTTLTLRVVHTAGMSHMLPEIALEAGRYWEKTIEITGDAAQPFGMLRIEGTVHSRKEARYAEAETLLARVPEPVPGPLPDSPFGIHVSLREPDLEAVARLGYKWCRIHDASFITKWGYIEPEPGQWIWHDQQVALAHKHGLHILGMLDSTPPWASGADHDGYFRVYHAPKNIEDWRNYVRTVVTHYRGKIDQWEVWNEPWDMFRFFQGGTPQLYVQLLQTAYEEAKAANPDCVILGIDTYPPLWDMTVLALGAYPYYDALSWHRSDPNLPGRPGDSFARVSARLNAEQAKYGPPKPLIFSEGGPDVTRYHGSFFSFADPAVVGDWSRGADLYPRMFLSAIASGNKRFFAYSVHAQPRHGQSSHMLIEPGFLLRPMHATLAALAHFIEGAQFERRTAPAPDISALIFRQNNPRPYADAPSTVVVLYTDGENPEPLPRLIPESVRCYDRWGNRIPAPKHAMRGLNYLVASQDAVEALLESVADAAPESLIVHESPRALLEATVVAMSTAPDTPVWPLLSAQASLLVRGGEKDVHVANRMELRGNAVCLERFRLPHNARVTDFTERSAGPFTIGTALIEADDQAWSAVYAATQDGLGNSWRWLWLAMGPKMKDPSEESTPPPHNAAADVLKLWEKALIEAHTRNLHANLYDGPCSMASATLNGEYFVFDDPQYLITMMDTAVLWGPAQHSAMTFDQVIVSGPLVLLIGRWDIASLAFGFGEYGIAAALIEVDGVWRIIAMCAAA